MAENGNGAKQWTERYRWVTPMLLSVAVALLTAVWATVVSIDDKMFKHLTNDELHTPRSLTVMRPEFQMYQSMRDKQMEDVKQNVCEIKEMVKVLYARR